MTTTNWTGKASDGLWSSAGNWDNGVPRAGYDVVLPSLGSSAYTVTLSSTTPLLNSVTLGIYNNDTNAITLVLSNGTLQTSGAINLSYFATIEGAGAINAGGGITNGQNGAVYGTGAYVFAGTSNSGGLLDVTGVIGSGVQLGFANGKHAPTATLKLESSNTISSITISASNQTLEIGGSATVALYSAETVTGGAINVDLGGTLSANGISLVSGASLTATGTLTTTTLSASGSSITIDGSASTASASVSLTSSATLTLNGSFSGNLITVNNSAIQLNGATLTASSGVALSSSGALTGTGAVSGNITGAGSVTASGGTLTLTQAVGNVSGGTTSLVIGNGSSLYLTSTYGIGASSTLAPTLTFTGSGDLFQAINEGLGNIYIGTITSFAAGDYIKLASFGANDQLTYNSTRHTITISQKGSSSNSQTFTFDSKTTVGNIKLSQETIGAQTIDVLTICFMPGTMIRTPRGEVPVETLERGDLVMTADGDAKPVIWLGRQTIVSHFSDPVHNWPIRVSAGALADNVPSRDLLVSPDHALRVGDILVHAGALVNGDTIRRETQVPERFVYYHVELENHALILAENTPAETFIDNVERRYFDNWIEHEALYPEGRPMEELPYPRAKAHRQVPPAIRAELAERARAIRVAPAA